MGFNQWNGSRLLQSAESNHGTLKEGNVIVKRLQTLAAAFIAALAFTACDSSTPPDASGPATGAGSGEKKITVAYVTNGVDPFWDVAASGAKAAAEKEGVKLLVRMPPDGLADQKRMVEALITLGVDGIAISPIDAENQVSFLNEICKKTNLITHDSDSPKSNRLCFIGMNNYAAGRTAGELVKEAIPDGGQVMIFVGRLEQLNALQRRQGLIDELLGRPVQKLDALKFEPPDFKGKGDKYEILGTRTDNFDKARAKANAEDAIVAYPDLACMVGLFAYNPPLCLEALKGAGKEGKIKIVAFDEQDDTLKAIQKGTIHGTISQWPYNYGYQSVKVLVGLARGDKSVLPAGGYLQTELRIARKDTVDQFWKELKELRGGD